MSPSSAVVGAADEGSPVCDAFMRELFASIDGAVQVEVAVARYLRDRVVVQQVVILLHSHSWDFACRNVVTVFKVAVDVAYPDATFT